MSGLRSNSTSSRHAVGRGRRSGRGSRPRVASGRVIWRRMAEHSSPSDSLFLESLMDTNLYSMGAYFSDQHPELVEDVIEQSSAIEEQGLRGYAEANGMTVEACFETLLTGLAVRYYKAVAA